MMAGVRRGTDGIQNATLSTIWVLLANDINQVEETLKPNRDIAVAILEPAGTDMGTFQVYPS